MFMESLFIWKHTKFSYSHLLDSCWPNSQELNHTNLKILHYLPVLCSKLASSIQFTLGVSIALPTKGMFGRL